MYVYIIYSKSLEKYYTGQTQDLKNRLHRHNSGWQKHTKKGSPWNLVWSQTCDNREEAVKQESRIKRSILKKFFTTLLIYFTINPLYY